MPTFSLPLCLRRRKIPKFQLKIIRKGIPSAAQLAEKSGQRRTDILANVVVYQPSKN